MEQEKILAALEATLFSVVLAGGKTYLSAKEQAEDSAAPAGMKSVVLGSGSEREDGLYEKTAPEAWRRLGEAPSCRILRAAAEPGEEEGVLRAATGEAAESEDGRLRVLLLPILRSAARAGATLVLDGGAPLEIRDPEERPLKAGALVEGGILVGAVCEGAFRLLSDLAGAAIRDALRLREIREEAAARSAEEVGAALGIYAEPRDRVDSRGVEIQAGMTRLCWDRSEILRYAGYWLDFSGRYEVKPAAAKHFFHMYGDVSVSSGQAGGQITGFYAHLDVDPKTVRKGVTIDSIFPLRGNGTMAGDGVVTIYRGCYAGSRVIGASNGVIRYGYGGFFEAVNQTSGAGGIVSAVGVEGQARNVEGAVMQSAVGVQSWVRNQAKGGGVTMGVGFYGLLEDEGLGVDRYYCLYGPRNARAKDWFLYSEAQARSLIEGDVGLGGAPGAAKLVVQAAGRTALLVADAEAALEGEAVQRLRAAAAAGEGYDFLRAESDDGADLRFSVDGLGTTRAQSGFRAGGSGYAEWFEWADGGGAEEDRRGIPVVLEGGKIRPASASDDPAEIIGVTAADPALAGGEDLGGWRGRYRRDAFGAPLGEAHDLLKTELLTPGGEVSATVEAPADHPPAEAQEWTLAGRRHRRIPGEAPHPAPSPRPALNPDWRPDRPYAPRAARPEWALVGLMGRLALRKGAPAGDRWRRLRALDAATEEWLVR